MHQITVSDILIDVERKEIKNLHLSVNPPNGKVRIAAPLNINDDAVRLFAVSKLAWIHKQQRKFAEQARQSEREFVSGESHDFKGERYLLNVIYQRGNPKVVMRNKTYIDLTVREYSTQFMRQRVLTEWYRKQLKAMIPDLVTKWQGVIGVQVNDWGVKQMKTKWGTCNIKPGASAEPRLSRNPERCWSNIEVSWRWCIAGKQDSDRLLD